MAPDTMRAPFLLLLVLFLVHCSNAPAAAQGGGGAPRWNTLSGNRPLVVARGGFSGLFPDSSKAAYEFAPLVSLDDVVLWCDVQLTKDEVPICLPELDLQNSTDVRFVEAPPFRNRTYRVNGNLVTGWFPSDYTIKDLANLSLIQGIFSRPPNFDVQFGINTVDFFRTFNSQAVWLNVQHALFYSQQKLNVTKVLLSARSSINIGYISSPEVSFLQSLAPVFRRTTTKLIFRFLSDVSIEPSSNQSYGSLLKNLTFVKTFASGILIPKSYIWPSGDYLGQGPTTVVADARKAKLEVFVSEFVNDAVIAFNYSYNPVAEYLNFLNLESLSVDGFISDFPATASGAIGCFSHLDDNTTNTGKPTIISHNGASGDYPGCTDMAYRKAIDVGANYIDCPVQFTKDGFLICMSTANLLMTTTITNSPFGTRFSTFPELQETNGIYTFNLTWDEIQNNMKPAISNPQFQDYRLVRNPAHKNDGNFMTLSDFLKLALSSSSSSALKGVVITVEHAAFLAEKLGLNAIDSVINAVNETGFNNQTKLEVFVQSSNSSSLIPFKEQTRFKILYKVTEVISNVDAASLADIKKFADAVAVRRQSIFPTSRAFITTQTKLVEKLKSANLSVYSYLLMNEFVNPPWDFFADPIIEIHNHVAGALVDGVITDYPESASLYRQRTCARENYDLPLVLPGGLLQAMAQEALPPAMAPFPALTESEVSEPPLPPALSLKPTNSSPAGSGTPTPSGQPNVMPPFMILAVSLALFLVIP